MAEPDASSVYSDDTRSKPSTTSGRDSTCPEDGAPLDTVVTTESPGNARLGIIAIVMVVFSVLLLVIAIFLLLKGQDDFESSFTAFAVDVVRHVSLRTSLIVGSFQTLGYSITSFAESTNSTWPNVTVSDFEAYAHNMLLELDADLVGFSPLVNGSDRAAWEAYSVAHQRWIQDAWVQNEFLMEHSAFANDEGKGLEEGLEEDLEEDLEEAPQDPIYPKIFRFKAGYDDSDDEDDRRQLEEDESNDGDEKNQQVDDQRDQYAPIWQLSPPPQVTTLINYNLLNEAPIVDLLRGIGTSSHAIISAIVETDLYEEAVEGKGRAEHEVIESIIAHPIYDTLSEEKVVVAFLYAVLPWDRYFQETLPDGVDGIICVVTNTCGQAYTFQINGPAALYLGEGDHHDTDYDSYAIETALSELGSDGISPIEGSCDFSVTVYPSSEYEDSVYNQTALIVTVAVASAMCLASIVALVAFGRSVRARERRLFDTAKRSTAIVSSLFPASVRDRLLEEATKNSGDATAFGGHDLSSLLSSNYQIAGERGVVSSSKPIADLFPACTVLFADLVGFTAWSSSREPSQVFTLLESIYGAFDAIARKRNVFKVETVGDCYVAVTGIPRQREDHAVLMARFARDSLKKLDELLKHLEVALGPDTSELSVRIGLHSGPVTAGVLRGERSRFQLFGDTVNTAARMESNGQKGRIHVSEETAKLLIRADKNWITPREDKILAKGKGEMQTYWLEGKSQTATFSASEHTVETVDGRQSDYEFLEGKTKRLVDWNVEMLIRILKQIVARRRPSGTPSRVSRRIKVDDVLKTYECPLEEVQEVISLPKYDDSATENHATVDVVVLPAPVVKQLNDFVSAISRLYRENPFHNFEHCSHVVMSVSKLMSRIVAPSSIDLDRDMRSASRTLHDHTYGITSDPLTQFACVFSALIHDVDHTGVPNTQVLVENQSLAATYKNRSVAEQNSLDIGWNLLMKEQYADLCALLFTTDAELRRFRKLVVNSVMATDISDKELKEQRNARWERAFSEATVQSSMTSENEKNADDRKATIVIEHLIQASDVSHTMQHWAVYRKWNERLFFEMYKAFEEGRAEKDPSEFWYQGELGFFDYYIIPLARKLKECGVFGVSSDEYLTYALSNREEWEQRGERVVAEMLEALNNRHARPKPSTFD